jgi:hypothetical protein
VTEEKSSSQNNPLISFICSLPFWWLGITGYQAAMLPSKNPDFIGLYSWEKVIGLAGIFSICVIGIKFVHPKLCSWMEAFLTKLNCSLPSPYIFFVCLFALGSLFTVYKGTVVGEDISAQVLSTQQFISGKINSPNIVWVPSNNDLSINTATWHIRPPGASWFALPGMFLGLSLGHAIKFSLVMVGLLAGIGWLKLSNKLGVRKYGLIYLSLLVGSSIGLTINRLGTMNSTLFAIVPWMLLWAIQISAQNFSFKRTIFRSILMIAIFYLLLGCFCLLKMSGLIVALTIGFVPLFLVYLKKAPVKKNLLLLLLVILSPLILFPVKILHSFNKENLGFDSQTLYQNQDYNEQSFLWGENFVESTKGKMLILSAFGSPGYALSIKPLIHSTRDFCLQFQSFIEWSSKNKTNVHAFICGTSGVIILVLLILLIVKNKKIFSNLAKRIFLVFYIVPFIGLAILSYLHGFNYSLYGTHTIEYALLLLLPILLVWEKSHLNRLVYKAFVSLSLTLPLLSIINLLTTNSKEGFSSTTEKERGLSSSRFSQAIEYIEKDSENNLDIIYFLPAGDMGDLVLRSKMRILATHFAGGNFPQLAHFKSSKELNIYLAYDKELVEIPEFMQATSNKFQNALSEKTILKDGIFVHKIKLLPTPSVS